MFAEKDGKLFYRYDNETVCVEAWGRNALRVRSTYNATFTAHDWALTEAVEHGDAKVTIFKDEAVGLGGFANMYAGNKIAALDSAKRAVEIEPDNAEYRQLLNRLENNGQYYQQYSGNYNDSCCVCDDCCSTYLCFSCLTPWGGCCC